VDFKAFISGCAGPALSDDERRFFAATRPCGLILFKRNCDTPEQIKALVDSFKDAVESDEILIMIDQDASTRSIRNEPSKPPSPARG
jgi:beta-N-acetylhexosaminidase